MRQLLRQIGGVFLEGWQRGTSHVFMPHTNTAICDQKLTGSALRLCALLASCIWQGTILRQLVSDTIVQTISAVRASWPASIQPRTYPNSHSYGIKDNCVGWL